MRTEELIRAMAADSASSGRVERLLPVALGTGAAAAGAVFYATMGVRPDLAEAIGRLPVAIKHLFPVLMALAAFGAVERLSRPEGRVGGWGVALLAAPAIVTISFCWTALTTPLAAWPATIAGHSIGACLFFISTIGAVILTGSLWALARGASTRPRLTGALAGLLSGSAAASVYALYCNDDSPMFWGVWYVLAIGVVTLLGAALGRRALAW